MFLDSDAPIQTSAHDLYKRYPLAKRLATLCMARRNKDAIVIGLDGPWGAGKTSLLNLIAEALGQRSGNHGESAIVVRFAPWLYDTPVALSRSLLQTIASSIERYTLDPKLKKRVARLFKLLSTVAADLQGAEAVASGFEPATGFAISAGTAVTGRVAASISRRLDRSEDDLRALQQELSDALADLAGRGDSMKLVVLVDDFDRAAAFEIVEFFRVTRLVLTIPNITFVVAMDRSLVSSSIERAGVAMNGDRYLEKFFQCIVAVPTATTDVLMRQLQSTIGQHLQQFGVNASPFNELFAERFWSGGESLLRVIERCIEGPRGVVLVGNAMLSRLIACASPMRLHAGDLFVLSVLQVSFPKVYHAIMHNPHKALGSDLDMEEIIRPQDNQAHRRRRLESFASLFDTMEDAQATIASQLNEVRSSFQSRRQTFRVEPPAVVLTRYLFPQSSSGLRPELGPEDRVERRICDPRHFPEYFAGVETVEATIAASATQFAKRLAKEDGEYSWHLTDELSLDANASGVFVRSLADELSLNGRHVADKITQTACTTEWLVRFERLERAAQETHVQIVLTAFDAKLRSAHSDSVEEELNEVMLKIVESSRFIVAVALADDMRILKLNGVKLPTTVVQSIANAVLERFDVDDAELVRARLESDFRVFSELFWPLHRLARVTGKLNTAEQYEPLTTHTQWMLQQQIPMIGHILALVGGWGAESNSGVSLSYKSLTQIRADLARVVDLEVFDAAMNRIVSADDVDGPHAWRLVTEYRKLSQIEPER